VSEIVDFKFPHFEISCVNEQIMIEREKLIKYNKRYFERHKQMPTTILDFYKFVQLIGKGAFGKVTLAIHKLTGRYVAIKAIDKTYMQDSYSRQKVLQEVYILRKIRHSNIIRLYEVFESEKHFLMVMEYASGGDLL
jgi:5'-AMP-activated protein kinase, catalytic alpha subunit